MINQEQNIPCPVCGSKIPFDTYQLLAGVQFVCPNNECNASIGLANESKPIVEQTMQKFEAVKSTLQKK
jgi:hypothetical protein